MLSLQPVTRENYNDCLALGRGLSDDGILLLKWLVLTEG